MMNELQVMDKDIQEVRAIQADIKNDMYNIEVKRDEVATKFHVYYGDTSASDLIKRFLDSRDSDKTRVSYECAINQFFSLMNTDIEHVTLNELFRVNSVLANQYVNHISDKYSSSTVRIKKNILQNMFNYIKIESKKVFNVDIFQQDNPFADINIKDNMDLNKVGVYGDYTENEIRNIIENTKRDSDVLLYKLAVITGRRLDDLLNLNVNSSFENVNGVYCIKGIGKHKQSYIKAITDGLYISCMDMAITNDNDGYVFKGMTGMKASRNILYRLYNTLAKIGINEDERKRRNLCFHSFRKCTASLVYKITGGDINAMQEALGHKSVTTTEGHYKVISEKDKLVNNYGEQIDDMLFNGKDVKSELASVISGLGVAQIKERLLQLDIGTLGKVMKVLEV